MKLTRRDAIRASIAGGVATGGTLALSELTANSSSEVDDGESAEATLATMGAIAEVVYPSAVDASTGFLNTYLGTLGDDRRVPISTAVTDLNERVRKRYGSPYYELDSVAKREAVLRSMGVDRVRSDPTGTVPERVKYHLVNSLLYALYTTPKGAELVGIDNPVGHPGGFATYRR